MKEGQRWFQSVAAWLYLAFGPMTMGVLVRPDIGTSMAVRGGGCGHFAVSGQVTSGGKLTVRGRILTYGKGEEPSPGLGMGRRSRPAKQREGTKRSLWGNRKRPAKERRRIAVQIRPPRGIGQRRGQRMRGSTRGGGGGDGSTGTDAIAEPVPPCPDSD